VLSLYKYACYPSRLCYFFVIDVVLERDIWRVDSLGINLFEIARLGGALVNASD